MRASCQAPELFQENMATYRVDIFAYGVLLWELQSGKVPFEGQYDPVIMAAAQQGKHTTHLSLKDIKDQQAATLIELCLALGSYITRTHSFIACYLLELINGIYLSLL